MLPTSFSFRMSAVMTRGVIVPTYLYPGGSTNGWAKVVTAAMYVNVVILNPNSGPGAQKLQEFTSVVQQSQAAGIKVLGYVASWYGNRAIADLVSEINSYRSWYQVDGFFIDEMYSVGEAQVLACFACSNKHCLAV